MTPTVYVYQATIASIHDGDSLRVNILLARVRRHRPAAPVDLGFNAWRTNRGLELRGQAVRLLGCNAPELSTPEGKAARDFIQTLIAVGDTVELTSYGWDKYGGRIDGKVKLADGRDLSQAMIDAGHALPWDGKGTKPV